MKFEERHSFDQPAQTVMRMYADKAFFDRKYKDVGAIECEPNIFYAGQHCR